MVSVMTMSAPTRNSQRFIQLSVSLRSAMLVTAFVWLNMAILRLNGSPAYSPSSKAFVRNGALYFAA